jgi:renalase
MTDVVVIGAGISGLVCAQQLTQAGYSVLLVEKSRGLGGRVATRRLNNTVADHGTCYLKPKGKLMRHFVELLCRNNTLQVWTETLHEFTPENPLPVIQSSNPNHCYNSPTGVSTIAKFLTPGLEILLNHRVISIVQTVQTAQTEEKTWHLIVETSDGKQEEITAKALVIAIPAPQALALVEPLGETLLGVDFLEKLCSVEFYSCLSVMAGYSPDIETLLEWKAVTFKNDEVLGWVGFDSSKRPNPQQPVFVLQSSANFAEHHLDSQDLQPAAEEILQRASKLLMLPWLATPEWMQIHRWRYAIPRTPLEQTSLPANTNLPLVCCGDWCGGGVVENALVSGMAAAEEINVRLGNLPLPGDKFLDRDEEVK